MQCSAGEVAAGWSPEDPWTHRYRRHHSILPSGGKILHALSELVMSLSRLKVSQPHGQRSRRLDLAYSHEGVDFTQIR